MFDLRPVGYLVGMIVTAQGLCMLVPVAFALWTGTGGEGPFMEAALLSVAIGGGTALAASSGTRLVPNIQQLFLFTSLVWFVLPLFAALPFWLGAPGVSYTDAFFEAMSGLTTTGATVMTGLDDMPHSVLLWRGMLQWTGGVGIVVMAMAVLPALKVGGMQIFRTEGFDTMGKVLPRAAEIAGSLSVIYIGLTVAAFLSYEAVGLAPFEALVHSFTTVSTGGMSTTDSSFGAFKGAPEYVASLFMILASLPFVRFVQMMNGSFAPIWRDSQVRTFILLYAGLVLLLALLQIVVDRFPVELALREAVFNVASIITGTGYASVDYQEWGPFAMVVFFLMGLIGGCAGSTCCSIKVFRYQLLVAAIKAQIRQIHSPHGVFRPHYEGRPIAPDVFSSVMAFFVLFMASLLVLSILLGLTGLDTVTAVSGAATALANIGPGLGEIIGPAGNFQPLNDTAKWLLSIGMFVGRLELMSVYVLFTTAFWRH